MKTILLTGGAGFIGSHLAGALLDTGIYRLICIDNLDDFYSPRLKRDNLERLLLNPHFRFVEADMTTLSLPEWQNICQGEQIGKIIHLAAKAGVRPSISDPAGYYRTNVIGMINLLEFARHAQVSQFIFSSSSSVYGDHPRVPWQESAEGLHPISPYAASKTAGEQIGAVYAHLHDIQFVALRLFTVYGPRQRPDLAVHKFYNLMKLGQPITLYGDGSTSRDYTFVGDIVNGIMAAIDFRSEERFNVFNIGSGRPVSLLDLVRALEDTMGKKADLRFTDEQPGDVKQTWADIARAGKFLHYKPQTILTEGIEAFLHWKENATTVEY
jgi:UDP-glucuronate 4-epimerase